MKAEALAELDAEDLLRADDYYHSRPYFRCADKHFASFCTPAEDFYKKPVLCAAHVVGIADPVKYRKSNNSQEPKVVRKGWNGQELKTQEPEVGVMDRAAANLIHTCTQMGRTTNVGDVEFFLEHMDRRVGGESSDKESPAESLYNAQGMLAFERARFRADCAARAIRTTADAEKHMCRITVARADVVRQKKYFRCM